MSNTNDLKDKVEPFFKEEFRKAKNCELIDLKKYSDKPEVLKNTEPDLVAYDSENQTIYIGEITITSYSSKNKRPLNSKVEQAFLKFYLYNLNKELILNYMKTELHAEFKNLECYLIFPNEFENLKFGYRDKVFSSAQQIIKKICFDVDDKSIENLILKISRAASNEQNKKGK